MALNRKLFLYLEAKGPDSFLVFSYDLQIFLKGSGTPEKRYKKCLQFCFIKVKLDQKSALRVMKNLERQKPAQRLKIQKAMSKNKSGFDRFVKILNV